MLTITLNELENDLEKYLDIVRNEDVLIVEGDKPLARLVSPYPEGRPIDEFLELAGILADSGQDPDQILAEREAKR